MPNWERRNADVLADAISKHIRTNPEMVEDNALLTIIQEAVDGASNTVTTTTGDLHRCRAAICAICRGSKLYVCDVDEDWSPNCAFIYANTTEFGGL
jgi:hypothetical protein